MWFQNKQKAYFKRKAEAVQKQIWDYEFKREKTLGIREEVRQEYDNAKTRIEVLEQKIKAQKEAPTISEDEIKRLEDQKVLLERDRDRFKEQLKGMDADIAGMDPTNEFPDGIVGINPTIDSLRELLGLVNSYIKKL